MYSARISKDTRMDIARRTNKGAAEAIYENKMAETAAAKAKQLLVARATFAANDKLDVEAEATDASASEAQDPLCRCVCHRKSKTLFCVNCKMFTYGRITQKCPEHANVTFLMDFISCPNCLGPSHLLRGIDLDYEVCQSLNASMQPTQDFYNYAEAGAADGK